IAISHSLSGERHSGLLLTNRMDLRYGENPHQWGAFYEVHGEDPGWTILQQDDGKPMSYLNILDADGAWNLVCEFSEPTAACIKHANPSGVATHTDITEAFQRSYDADRLSAFGVIIALNRQCPEAIIQKIIEQKIFAEILIAPGYSPEALELLKKRPKLRVIEYHCPSSDTDRTSFRSMLGGMLVQNLDTRVVTEDDLTVATELKPTPAQIKDLLFCWKVVKHAKSNAIVFAKDQVTVGIGCGQTSRVDSTIIAARRAGEKAKGAVMASDAFFPFPDSVEEAAKHGIAAIIQPGGSVRDEEVIAKANELGITMVFTGVRGFRH
ncbi:MAG: bifunctional phosphoribosylaminoimidazolecarboxamide formyltransferase/IMP cyclohydrolase, partial [Candidatus Peribacteraceae bacterium]